jgi:hypothetical protein
MEAIRIEQAKGTVVIRILNLRKQRLREVFRRIPGVDVHVLSIAIQAFKVRGFLRREVNEIKPVERWIHFQRTRGAPLDRNAPILRDMQAGTAETIDVVFFGEVFLKAVVYLSPYSATIASFNSDQ